MALQAITVEDRSFERAKNGTDFVREYMFPGGCLPRSRRWPVVRRATPMLVIDLEDIGRHYAETLRRWDENVTPAPTRWRPRASTPDSSACGTSTSATAGGPSSSATSSDVQMVLAMPVWRAPMSVRETTGA